MTPGWRYDLRGIHADALHREDGDDTLFAGAVGDTTMFDEDGDDVMHGENNDDDLFGALGEDTLVGGLGADFLQGGGDDDRLHGGPGDDTLEGGPQSDTLYGSRGNDSMDGGNQDDFLCERAGYFVGGATVCDTSNTYIGGNGDDVAYTDYGDDWQQLGQPVCNAVTSFLGNHTTEVAGLYFNGAPTYPDRDWDLVLRQGASASGFPEPPTCLELRTEFGE